MDPIWRQLLTTLFYFEVVDVCTYALPRGTNLTFKNIRLVKEKLLEMTENETET